MLTFTGNTAIYFGADPFIEYHNDHILMNNQPIAVCDKTAHALKSITRKEIYTTASTWFYDSGGCC